MDKLSLLHPADVEPEYRQLPEETVHDLSFETICQGLSQMEAERNLIRPDFVAAFCEAGGHPLPL